MSDQSTTTGSTSPFQDTTDLATEIWALTQRTQEVAMDLWMGGLGKPCTELDPDPFNLGSAWVQVLDYHLRNPESMLQTQAEYCSDMTDLWIQNIQHWCGIPNATVIEPESGDRRFNDSEWSENPVFEYIKQAYLLSARNVAQVCDGGEYLDPKEASKLAFFTKQWINAVAPTNFLTTNPLVLRDCVQSSGKSLVDGLNNLLDDMKQSRGQFQMTLSDPDAFELGTNLATTKGKVVFQNELFQLLQYSPTTDRVMKAPLLVIPPWINKYYILDLQPGNSKIKWWIDQGHTVFVVSWVNPDASYANTTFEDYVVSGVYTALDAVTEATGEATINTVGYCIGGTLLATTLAHMAAKGDSRVQSATFLTTLIDFSEPGEIGAFLDESQVTALEREMNKKGYLEGSAMGSAFNMLRANDLIWNTVINRYLRGKPPRAFDLLYWNSDSTRMPAAMHSYYLRQMYLHNRLCKPGGLKIAGESLDISQIDIPVYFLSTEDDHIAPWRSTYQGAKLMSGPVRFILGGSGHIAGAINPPDANKYHYLANNVNKLPDRPDQWLQKTISYDGSWWLDWAEWIAEHNIETVAPRVPGDGPLRVIEDAPGSYVRQRIN